eukprot:NODE_2453_length_426_cov_61.392573_g2372_i0.p1 GENE.NODE_2453_length_426_cov_61.392573_g2372_i0~~NODE_2453_length_426_cov_61.392573_g2372_i0.p1  ORF type:complete len:69 (-),score=21.36 NODE_2453_length_426_cov_61.392573_g2372_i0:219-404(-)
MGEQCEKKMRGVSATNMEVREIKEGTQGGIADFKIAIGNHYTDDELSHLGSSRHFFPVTKK